MHAFEMNSLNQSLSEINTIDQVLQVASRFFSRHSSSLVGSWQCVSQKFGMGPSDTVPDDALAQDIFTALQSFLEQNGYPQKVILTRSHASIVAMRRAESPKWEMTLTVSPENLRVSLI